MSIFEKDRLFMQVALDEAKKANLFLTTALAVATQKSVSLMGNRANGETGYFESLGNENQKICVTLNILYDEKNKLPHYKIKSWNLAKINAPVYEDNNIELWEGVFENDN